MLDMSEYVGSVVEAIDGVEAIAAITEFANQEVGKCRDQGARFNLV